MRRVLFAGFLGLAVSPIAVLHAQFGFTNAFKPEEFTAHRARVMEKIGDGIAVIHGSAEFPAYVKFRQNNQFFYLTGVEVPRAVLVIDGKAHSSTLFLPNKNEGHDRSEGPLLAPDDQARRITGIERVVTRDSVVAVLGRLAREGRPIYAPFRSEARVAGTPAFSRSFEAANVADPLDGNHSREWALVDRLKTMSGGEVKDLDPVIDGLRMYKTPAEIAVMREASKIAALGLVETMRSARPGMYEYELAAFSEYVYRRQGAEGPGYFALISADTNAFWPHYHEMAAKIGPNALVLDDYSPDYKNYTADVTRMFPISGKFTPRQREMYTIYVRLYKALETSIKPKVPVREITADAVQKMDRIMAEFRFTDPKIKAAAERFVNQYRNGGGRSLGHTVGMEVHDVNAPFETLLPGHVFAIEPALTIPDERIYIRIEDVILMTETGYENLSALAPSDPDAIERLMREEGIGKRDKVVP